MPFSKNNSGRARATERLSTSTISPPTAMVDSISKLPRAMLA
jgi:hypothetical protein